MAAARNINLISIQSISATTSYAIFSWHSALWTLRLV